MRNLHSSRSHGLVADPGHLYLEDLIPPSHISQDFPEDTN